MFKIFKFFAKILIFTSLTFTKDIYQSIRLKNPSQLNISIVANLGIPLDHIGGKKGIFIDLICTEEQTKNLLSNGLDIEILVSDLTSFYKKRNKPAISRNFPLGSMQGNYTWDELNNRFDELLSLYPNIISERLVIGQSIEGRDIWAFKISDNPNIDEDEPEVLYTSLIHAREPVSMMSLFYFTQHLAENYILDDEITYLINNREMWFIPVINPDGYVYNQTIEPDGGGMHRKNRRNTNCGNGTTRGVDLNRNFGFEWGADNIGSSSDPCSDVYRGESAFSEPEAQAVRDFINEQNFKNVLNFHTFANTYIHPFGNGSYPDEPDLTTHREIGNEMARYNDYFVGNCLESINYTVNGDASDWSYGVAGLISFAPEVGSYAQQFWPPANEVEDLCESQIHPNKTFSFVAGPDIIVHSYDISEDFLLPGSEAEIEILIQNRGLTNSDSDIEVSFSSLNNWISLEMEAFTLSELDARDSDDITLPFTISADASAGLSTGILVNMSSQNSYSRSKVIELIIGEPQIVFFDNFENGADNWILNGSWGLTEDALDGDYALTDSPTGDYLPNQQTVAEVNFSINGNFLANPKITYNAKWDIHSNRDFVRIQAFVDNVGWVSLQGDHTIAGSGQSAQPDGEHGYDGFQANWVNETIHLNQLENLDISSFRFIQTSNNYIEGDGFVVDNFKISGYPLGLYGDFNSDAEVNIFDILGLADLLLFGSEPNQGQLFFCDFDNNGMLDVMDLLRLSNFILGF